MTSEGQKSIQERERMILLLSRRLAALGGRPLEDALVLFPPFSVCIYYCLRRARHFTRCWKDRDEEICPCPQEAGRQGGRNMLG